MRGTAVTERRRAALERMASKGTAHESAAARRLLGAPDPRAFMYVLDGQGEPVPCYDVLEWGRWFQENGDARQVAVDQLDGDVLVSTVFLGMDHAWNGGPPVLWELMVFRGGSSGHQERFASRADAADAHAKMVAALRGRKELTP
jgi:hypothetical protein